ncbi:Uncharacterized NAD(P)/FAD-binding protein YdhS [Bowdeniella nasicola]|uniref:Uncharacterized NAD(P)/FAD-binding protein YdhS n=1 Tax=Bowdeniella nasicola TaxID=208480 RepID=A0A1H4D4R9_9ACTO|nr:FAD/NAD(P)-binding domain-containing protein [Bowdeniella nasicola]SEA67578.1 Uncharacterized NAD(P)/FAD-binding protein YdhS [Bowdeniella nasicola]
MSPSPLVVAIIGAGPRGLNCLQSLASAWRDLDRPIDVHLFGALDADGVRVAGAGSAFAPDQPDFLRLNAKRSIIDMFYPARRDGVEPIGVTFSDWLDDVDPAWHGVDYPPRARVGTYLGESYRFLRSRLPATMHLTEHGPATAVRRANDGGWEVESDAATVYAHEVMLALGHSTDRPAALSPEVVAPIPVIGAVYPVSRLEAIRPGATVVVRGAALTFIDASLALTEGRGGSFERDEDGRLHYRRGDNEPAAILPIARQGRFLDVKPPAGLLATLIGEDGVARADASVRASQDPLELLSRIGAIIEEAGGDSAEAMTDPEPAPSEATAQLRTSIEVARGRQESSQGPIVGAVWTTMYDAIIETLAHREWPDEQWREFLRVDALMERRGFGPPPINGEKLLALIEAGIVDTSWLDAGIGQGELTEQERLVDVVIDAVLPPSGFWSGAYPALAPIEEYLGVFAAKGAGGERRGVRIAPDASVLSAAGEPIPGLAAVGRITNDWVLGHDTLERRMDPRPERWAQRLAQAP